MTFEIELQEIALRLTDKGYDWEAIRDSDDLYEATEEEKEKCCDYVTEIGDYGSVPFAKKYNI